MKPPFDFPGNIFPFFEKGMPKKTKIKFPVIPLHSSQTDINHRRQLMSISPSGKNSECLAIMPMRRWPMTGMAVDYTLQSLCRCPAQQIDSFWPEFPDKHLSSHPSKRALSRSTSMPNSRSGITTFGSDTVCLWTVVTPT
jgi:hypothetical protein